MAKSRKMETDLYIKDKIGDYLSAKEIKNNIPTRILNKWRTEGLLEHVYVDGKWYYSRKSLANAMKTATIKDLRK